MKRKRKDSKRFKSNAYLKAVQSTDFWDSIEIKDLKKKKIENWEWKENAHNREILFTMQ